MEKARIHDERGGEGPPRQAGIQEDKFCVRVTNTDFRGNWLLKLMYISGLG